MRQTPFWILIALLTFALGVATVLVWFNRPKLANEKAETVPSQQESRPSTEQTTLTYCELANNSEKYDGKIVRVSAKLWFMIHGYSFLSKNCDGETKQIAVIFPDDKRGLEIENKIAKDLELTEYNPWSFPEIIAIGKFSRVKPSRKSDSIADNTYLHFEILEVEKASKQ
jgi:hypothetical protein